jgi:hypothetical protein
MPKLMLGFNQGTFFFFSEPFNGNPLHLNDILVESTYLKQCTLDKKFEIEKIYEIKKVRQTVQHTVILSTV